MSAYKKDKGNAVITVQFTRGDITGLTPQQEDRAFQL